MKFEASPQPLSPEDEPQFEKLPIDSIESLSGPLAEGFRMCFGSKQMEDFIEDVFTGHGLDLIQAQFVPEEEVAGIIALSASYFDLKADEQAIRSKEIADQIQATAHSQVEEGSEVL